jgi:hypothetical protein
MSFTVDQIGVPVLVRVSYFPNWEVTGAEGPYRVAPNMMVVIPTANEVELNYGLTNIDYASYAVTLLGVIGLFVLWRRGQVVYPVRIDPWAAYPPDVDPFAVDRPYTYEAVAPAVPVIAGQSSSFDSFDFDDRRSAATTTDDDDFHAWAFGSIGTQVADPDQSVDQPVTGTADETVFETGDGSLAGAPSAAAPSSTAPIPPAPYLPPAPIDPETGWAVPSGRPLAEPPGAQFWTDNTPAGTPSPEPEQLDAGENHIDDDGK